MVEVPVAVMNGTAAAMRSSRLRGRLRMEEVISTDELNFLASARRALGGTRRFFGELGPSSLFCC